MALLETSSLLLILVSAQAIPPIALAALLSHSSTHRFLAKLALLRATALFLSFVTAAP
jgi:hypothetical protein